VINRIRDVRKEKGMTLAEVGAACRPPTTAQTIGRLETGMRNLSLGWMNKIAAALGVEPEMLVRGEERAAPQIVARLTEAGAEPLTKPREAVLPTELGALIVRPQPLARIEQTVRQMPARVQPGERRFGEIDGDAAPPLARRGAATRAFAGQFAFDEVLLHVFCSGGLGNLHACQSGLVVGK
jgi:transcriptional regulator with XRE-family HTH domain